MTLTDRYKEVRQRTENICMPLQTEDYVVQPVVDVSPPKWHIGHTTWFFETFILQQYHKGYQPFNADYNFVFNSYYEAAGARVVRTDRGNLSRPTVSDIYKYRKYVDEAMINLMATNNNPEVDELIVLGLNHEEQHQELLMTDIKYILGNNPLLPAYTLSETKKWPEVSSDEGLSMNEGLYDIGYNGSGFCFDNELGRHKVFLTQYTISKSLVTNGQYLAFIEDGGYSNFKYWHAEGWDWVKNNHIISPMYWHHVEGKWKYYTLQGLKDIDVNEPVTHVSYYEAAAFAAWSNKRLPTEFEWEAAADQLNWGSRWEWTESAYLPYPGFSKAPGALGEYNGKFMVNQKVLRGASEVTPPGHSRKTYRNFFHAPLRWQYTGIRLAQ